MKRSHYILYFTSLLIIFLFWGAILNAQDTNLPLSEPIELVEVFPEIEPILHSPEEADPGSSQPKTLQPVAKDSILQKTPGHIAKVANDGNQEKPTNDIDDSILSFNFLYYIIQKFKMSDIVDQ